MTARPLQSCFARQPNMAPSNTRMAFLTLFSLSFLYLVPRTAATIDASSFQAQQMSEALSDTATAPFLEPQLGEQFHTLPVNEAPAGTHSHVKRYGSGQPYWVSQIARRGKVAYGNGNSSYVIWRNVMDYGAKGDGITDDTYAINNATFEGVRCELGCDSQTTTPAIVYFPAGTYLVSTPLIQLYYTQFIGDANNLPTIKATPKFYGIGLIDSDVYLPYGFSWYTNQNNFYRQIRNFVLDITAIPPKQSSHCLHWQVAQATSLQNIVFNMVQGTPNDGNQQMGIFMDNGSGGFMEDLIFNGGSIGFFSGNQQFTVRNLTFNGCETGIFQNWNWVFNYKSMTFNGCGTAIDLSQGGEVPATGSVVVQDSVINNCGYGIITSFSSNSTPVAAGTLVVDNVLFANTPYAVLWPNGTVIIPGNQRIDSFVQGNAYSAYEHEEVIQNLTCWEPTANYSRIQELTYPMSANAGRVQQLVTSPPKSASLLDSNVPAGLGPIFYERSKPQYEGVPVANFIHILDYGCAGDGLTDDSDCVQNFFNALDGTNNIAYVDHGAYLVSRTITIPNNIKIQGEIWPLFMVDGASAVWQNVNDPKPAFVVGAPGDTGTTKMVELVFETRGPAPGCVILEWNLAGTQPTATGMWDVHFRIGGSNGTLLQSNTCTKQPTVQHASNPSCVGSFLLMHIRNTASLIMSNNWGWVADHELDLTDHNQIDIYNGRGILVESQGPVWLYGTSFEHSMLYNYQLANAKEVYMGIIQSETM